MATARTPMENLTLKYPKMIPNSVGIGESQMKNFSTNSDHLRHGTPAFTCQLDVTIRDTVPLLDVVPHTATVFALHVRANIIKKGHRSPMSTFRCTGTCARTLQKYYHTATATDPELPPRRH